VARPRGDQDRLGLGLVGVAVVPACMGGGAEAARSANGATVPFPRTLLKLSWAPVPYAAKYRLELATDPALGNLWSGRPVDTEATTFVPRAGLKTGTYYWAVTPLDAEGNGGSRSASRRSASPGRRGRRRR
jgi:hypothetical protein